MFLSPGSLQSIPSFSQNSLPRSFSTFSRSTLYLLNFSPKFSGMVVFVLCACGLGWGGP